MNICVINPVCISPVHLDNFIKDNPDWIPGEGEWATSDDLSENYVSFGRSVNRMAGTINYTVVFTTDPKLHNDAIFDYTITASKNENNITSISESGNISPYFTNKNILIFLTITKTYEISISMKKYAYFQAFSN